MTRVAVLGCTGSIGRSTLAVLGEHPGRFRVTALAAARDWRALLEQARRFAVPRVALADESAAMELQRALGGAGGLEVLAGSAGVVELAREAGSDVVMAAISGSAGLASTLAAAEAGKRVLLANKETLVMAGRFFMEAVHRHGATLLPIDSEHNAVFQSLPGGYKGDPASHGVRRVLLTASGGPFRTRALESLHEITPEEAVAHPNWVMGKKISVDSATMMNKGLEVIEARWLFDARPDQIEVVIHPQSIIHSMVEYLDGSVLAQLSNPDMRTPIAHSLAYPERVEAGVPWLDLAKIGTLTFESPDLRRFPCLGLAYEALAAGGAATAMLNAANEEAVAAFLDRRIPYLAIAATLDKVLQKLAQQPADSLEQLLEADAAARRAARAIMAA